MDNKTSYATTKVFTHTHTEDCWKSLDRECVEHHIRERDVEIFKARAKIARWQIVLRGIQGSAVKMDNEIKAYLAE